MKEWLVSLLWGIHPTPTEFFAKGMYLPTKENHKRTDKRKQLRIQTKNEPKHWSFLFPFDLSNGSWKYRTLWNNPTSESYIEKVNINNCLIIYFSCVRHNFVFGSNQFVYSILDLFCYCILFKCFNKYFGSTTPPFSPSFSFIWCF